MINLMTSKDIWSEVDQAKREKRHELVLSGPAISLKISECGLDKNIFHLDSLNYLNINQTSLEIVPEEIHHLENLTTLVLHSNKISYLPRTMNHFTKLKILDCSRNRLEALPNELSSLPQLTMANFSSNFLTDLPSQHQNTKLISLDLSNNKFVKFPNICHAELIHLAEIRINSNNIEDIPVEISILPALKHLDLGDNSIVYVPGELADCHKLKELNLKKNKLADKRLAKLVDQCRTKQILDYIRQYCPKLKNNGPPLVKGNKKGKSNKIFDNELTAELSDLTHKLRIAHLTDANPVVKITENVKAIRPHIIACIVRNLLFTEENFKKFIQLQTKIHEGICEKRNAATLATHDLDSIAPGDLTYTAMPPREMKIKPLGRKKTYTAAALFQQLQVEADKLRREKKRNIYSGVHKFLYLIEGKPLFPCLTDAADQVISFPPITNSDGTKMSFLTRNMFVEVTSTISQQICRIVMDQFLKEMVTQGLGSSPEDSTQTAYHELYIEQIKIVDIEGNLKQVYPSRMDLIFDDSNVTVIRS